MEKEYKINKYAIKVLEGLGYRVITDSKNTTRTPMQGVYTLVDKNTGISLPSGRANLLDLSDEEWESGMAQFFDGTPTDIYTGKNETIYLSKYGETDIRYPDGPSIHIPNYDEDSMQIKIRIEDSKGRNVEITHHNNNYNYPGYEYRRNGIVVSTGFHEDRIAFIEGRRTDWRDYQQRFDISECTPPKVTKHLISRIRTYDKGRLWSPEIKKGLEVITPALAQIVLDFKHGWLDLLDEMIEQEEKNQRKAKKSIDTLIEEVAASEIQVVSLNNSKKEIEKSLEPKQLRKKRKETQQA